MWKATIGFMCSGLIAIICFSSCNQKDDSNLDVPSVYEFTRDGGTTVNYSGQTQRLDMLELLGNYLKNANTVGANPLDAQVLKNMFANRNEPFTGQTFTKELLSKCYPADTLLFLQLLQEVADISAATGTASDGVEGVLVDGSPDQTNGYRVNANGIELRQVIIKGMMGSVFYYQAMEEYLTEDKMGLYGNDDLVSGENYTAMEHYFDEVFGYFGVPTDFPSINSLDDVRFFGEYCNTRNENLYPGINDELSNAFRTARAAIVAKEYETRDQAIQKIMDKWAVVIAASAVHYLEEGLSTSGESVYKRHHEMSEAIGFMIALKYHFSNGDSKYPPQYDYSHIEDALNTVGLNTNLYALTDTEIQHAIDHIKMAFPSGVIK